MAIRLQFLSVVVRRSAFAGCRNLPGWYHQLAPAGGFFWDTTWFDAHLWCETSMEGGEDLLAWWAEQGLQLRAADGSWLDLCVAASGRGPLGPCPWLEYSPDTNAVWLTGTEPGAVIGGQAHQQQLEQELARSEAGGETAYERMYDARRPKDAYEDACEALGHALAVARFLNRQDDAARIQARLDHIRGVYHAQFRGW